MATSTHAPDRERLWAYALFAAVLSGAGLPIYIFAPKFFADTYGVSLTALGAVLFGLRLFDVVQDPVLGWLAERLNGARRTAIGIGSGVLALSMLGLFTVTPPVPALWWFGITITGLFSAYSFLTICFYAQGVIKAGAQGQIRLAAWRESGSLLGVCIAAVAPTILALMAPAPFATYAWGFAALALLSAFAMAPEWRLPAMPAAPMSVRNILKDTLTRRLLILALVNATPLAVSSTLFLFFVESRLQAQGWEGPLLVLFFLAAAVSAPLWSWLARRFGAKPMLMIAMVLAIVSFGFVLLLGPGDQVWFALICIVSGATIGADLVLLPALFAQRMAQISPNAAQGFGLWAFVSKFTLAIAAATLLPTLEAAGFQSGGENSAAALTLLSQLYALVPCMLKVLALGLLFATPLKGDRHV